MTDKRPYRLTLATPPAAEPLTLNEAKLYLRVDGSTEDDSITSLITAARMAAEQYLRRSLITQSWVLAYDDYLLSATYMPMGPVQSVASVTLVARDGGTTTLDSSTYYLTARKDMLIFDATPFSHQVEIAYVAGFGNAANVPSPIKQGLYLHLAALYANRSGSGEIPAEAVKLYAGYRVVRI